MRTPLRVTGSIGVLVLFCIVGRSDVRAQREHGAIPPGPPGPFALTVSSIMRGPKLVGYAPSGLRWSADSNRLYFEWRQANELKTFTWVVNRDGGSLRKLTDPERRDVPPAAVVWDRAHRRALAVDDGDIVLFDSRNGTRQQITRTTAREARPRWAKQETAITFVRENNLYLMPLTKGNEGLLQLTDVQPRRGDPRESDSQKFIKAEELQLFDHNRTAKERRDLDEAEQKARALPKFELRERQSVTDLQLTPDGKHAFLVVSERGDARRTDVANFITQSGYTEQLVARAKVGDTLDKQILGLMDLDSGKSVPVDAAFAGPSRQVSWSMPLLSGDGKLAVAAVRAVDNTDRWLVEIDRASGKTRVVDAQHDEAWIREQSDSGVDGPGSFGFLPDDKKLWFLSERDGWMHLYVVDASTPGASAQQLTKGRFEVSSVSLSFDDKLFYLTTNEVHPGERHTYTMPVSGGGRTRLTSMPGAHDTEVAPDQETLAFVHSYVNKPPEVYVMANRPGAAARQVTISPTTEWRSVSWVEPQVITYGTRDGQTVYARLYTPEMVGARRDPSRPAVVFVHGAGYLQNAHRYWSTYFREYMFHHLLAARGYVVLDPDYRASAGYGRDWRTAIYQHMGGKDLDDVVDGVSYLAAKEGVDPKRVGVYGGSYGGFITLMALFTSPDTFAAGAALRPVTDWAHYNHPYTANILNEPQTDPEAYRRSSPIYFADGLKSPLLICHGMLDTNVLFQDTVRLVQRLVELRKENWELAAYPVENHGFEEEASWADEYARILKLFDTNLKGLKGN